MQRPVDSEQLRRFVRFQWLRLSTLALTAPQAHNGF
jgi:hypothetical protein